MEHTITLPIELTVDEWEMIVAAIKSSETDVGTDNDYYTDEDAETLFNEWQRLGNLINDKVVEAELNQQNIDQEATFESVGEVA